MAAADATIATAAAIRIGATWNLRRTRATRTRTRDDPLKRAAAAAWHAHFPAPKPVRTT